MKRAFWLLCAGLVCLMSLGLVGCNKRMPLMMTKKEEVHAQQQRACINQCGIEKSKCLEHCQYSCKHCEKYESTKMAARYKKYIHEQNIQGKRVALQLQSFRDPLQCRKASCDCQADYRVCVGQCRGKIRKQLQVKPFCC